MHLSYRGVPYTIAPRAAHASMATSETNMTMASKRVCVPTAAIPMRYRGILFLLERFTTVSVRTSGVKKSGVEPRVDSNITDG